MGRIALLTGLLGVGLVQAQQTRLPSDELNRQMPSWLRFSGETRVRAECFTAGFFRERNQDAYLLHRVRLNLTLQPNGWLRFAIQGQDARAPFRDQQRLPPLARDPMDLRMAYVELGDLENRPFGLRAGRQELAFGDQRLVGPVNWLNTGRTFDALRVSAGRNGLRIDAFAASEVVVAEDEFNRRVDGQNLHGLYGRIEKRIPGSDLHLFAFWRLAPRVPTEAGPAAKLDFKTAGFRWFGRLGAGFDYSVQSAAQRGSIGGGDVSAWAGEWEFGRRWSAPWQPRLSLEFNHASGDEDPRDGDNGTFDILLPTPHDLFGVADQVGWKNIRHLRAGVELQPRQKWRLKGNYHSWWRESLEDGLYNGGGALLVASPGPSAGRHIGQELDIQVFYSHSRRLQIAAGLGHIFPGTFLRRASEGASYTYPYVLLNWAF